MTLSFISLLINDVDVPVRARAALRAAIRAPASEQRFHLEVAARALYREAHLDCADALELVGLAAPSADQNDVVAPMVT